MILALLLCSMTGCIKTPDIDVNNFGLMFLGINDLRLWGFVISMVHIFYTFNEHIRGGRGKGIQINTFMAATAWNLKEMMEKLKVTFLYFYFPAISPAKLKLYRCLKITFQIVII